MNNTGQIVKTRAQVPFTQIPNSFLRDNSISLKAKGLLSFLLSLPNDWVIYKSTLTEYFSDGKDSIRSAWDELEKNGYIVSTQQFNGTKFAGWNHVIYFEPVLPDKIDIDATDGGKSALEDAATTNKEDTNKEKKINIIPKNQLFRSLYPIDSEGVQRFSAAMAGYAKGAYAKYDLEYYYHQLMNWSNSKEIKRADWLATCATFIRKDIDSNKAKMKKVSSGKIEQW